MNIIKKVFVNFVKINFLLGKNVLYSVTLWFEKK